MNKTKYGTEFLDQLKDKVHEQQWEIEELKQRLEDINYYIEQRCKEEISETEKAILQSIELISKGIVKAVKERENE